jgi:hypothetical protein
MTRYSYSDFALNMGSVFNKALTDEVVINDNVGNSYQLLPVRRVEKGKSPLEGLPSIKADITTQEIVDILHECRAGNM